MAESACRKRQKGWLRRRFGSGLIVALLLLIFSGCQARQPGPPKSFPITELDVLILASGQPIPGAWITLVPFGGTQGDHRMGQTDAHGKLRLRKVPVGQLQVRIEVPPTTLVAIPSLKPRAEWLASTASPLEVTTTTEPMVWEFDLVRSQIPSPSPSSSPP